MGLFLREGAVAVLVGAEEEAADQEVAGVYGLFLGNLAVVVLIGQLEEDSASYLEVFEALDGTWDVLLGVVGPGWFGLSVVGLLREGRKGAEAESQ